MIVVFSDHTHCFFSIEIISEHTVTRVHVDICSIICLNCEFIVLVLGVSVFCLSMLNIYNSDMDTI